MNNNSKIFKKNRNTILFLISFLILIIQVTQQNASNKDYCSSNIDRKQRFLKIYKSGKKIGSGGFGKITGNGKYAIKQVLIKNKQDQEQIQREIATQLQIDDINFAKTMAQGCYTDIQKNQYYVYIQMVQYKKNLSQLMSNNFSMFWKADQIFKILSSFKKIHDKQLCHFDIKPQNIFYLNNYTPIIGDFGLSNYINDAQRQNFWGGTEKYLGMSVMKRGQNLSFQKCGADLFALGVTIFEILVGQQNQFVNSNLVTRYKQIQTGNLLLQKFGDRLKKMMHEETYSSSENQRGSITTALADITMIIQDLLQQYQQQFQQFLDEEQNFYNTNEDHWNRYFSEDLLWQYNQRMKIYKKNYSGSLIDALNIYCTINNPGNISNQNYIFKSPNQNSLNSTDKIEIPDKNSVVRHQDINQETYSINQEPQNNLQEQNFQFEPQNQRKNINLVDNRQLDDQFKRYYNLQLDNGHRSHINFDISNQKLKKEQEIEDISEESETHEDISISNSNSELKDLQKRYKDLKIELQIKKQDVQYQQKLYDQYKDNQNIQSYQLYMISNKLEEYKDEENNTLNAINLIKYLFKNKKEKIEKQIQEQKLNIHVGQIDESEEENQHQDFQSDWNNLYKHQKILKELKQNLINLEGQENLYQYRDQNELFGYRIKVSSLKLQIEDEENIIRLVKTMIENQRKEKYGYI